MAIKMALPLQKFGTHVIIARIEGQEARRVDFNVVAGPNLAMQVP
jgi:hypothetical protein